ncbi:MAG TPA: methyl-accepting chemotaxis protein [Pseudomonadota bacterium]|nr:methyl-accepting chemotaxis protein [Pseudomonadota bacterium]
MRLRVQLLLVAFAAMLLCGGLSIGVLWNNLNASAETMLTHELQVAGEALLRQWQLSHNERHRAYESIVRQPYLRAYLAQRDQSQMDYYAETILSAGASSVVILDKEGSVLSQTGKDPAALLQRNSSHPEEAASVLIGTAESLQILHRLPVLRSAGQAPIGLVLVSNRVQASQLTENAHALGIEVALAAGDVLMSSFAPRDLSATNWNSEDGRSQLAKLSSRYLVSQQRYGDAKLIIAVPRERMRALTTTFPRQIAGVLLVSLLGIVIVCLVILVRISEPMATLRTAVSELGRGQLRSSRNILRDLPRRQDEIGELGEEFGAATQRISTVVKQCQRLSIQLGQMVRSLDRTAASIASSAQGQSARIKELTAAFGPLTKATEESAQLIEGMMPLATHLSQAVQNVEQDAVEQLRSSRLSDAQGNRPGTAAAAAFAATQPAGAAAKELTKQTAKQADQLRVIHVNSEKLLQKVHMVSRSLLQDKYQSAFVLRGMAYLGRMGTEHSQQASELKATADKLRRAIHRLQTALDLFDTGMANFGDEAEDEGNE